MAGYTLEIKRGLSGKTLNFIQSILSDLQPRNFSIELWDGSGWAPERNQFRRFTWKINNPNVLTALVHSSNPQVALGEAYIRGDFEIVGDMEAVFPLADYLINRHWSAAEKLRCASLFATLPKRSESRVEKTEASLLGQPHSRKRDQEAVCYHYDVSNQFYALWLDRNMVYSCAYFKNPADDLDTAQLQKMDQICRALCLKPGERLVDIGCGWGGLIIHAVRKYGVRAVGMTLSQAQAEFAQGRIRAEGLSDRCEVRRLDYRDLHELGGCDKLVSVGMVEHVGASNLEEYFRLAFSFLRSGGLFLNSGIATAANRPRSDEPTFTDLYVFPDAELVTIATMLAHAERASFEVRSTENLREHYCRTTRQWLHRLEAKVEEARQIVGETRYRTWRLYLAGSAYYFQEARLGLYHTVLAKHESGGSSPSVKRAW